MTSCQKIFLNNREILFEYLPSTFKYRLCLLCIFLFFSDATLLAPQEIADKKKGEDIGSSERTITDKKRDLRLKKTKQRKIQKAKEQKQKLVDKLNPNGLATKHSKKAALKAIEQAEKEGKVKTIKDKNKGIKSSKAFFDKMQNEVQGIVSDIRAEKSKKKNKNINVAALKL